MSKRGQWGPMADRIRTPEPVLPQPTQDLKHCWVTDRHGRLPALLLQWRRTPDGFQGRVVHPVFENGEWVIVEEWLPAALLDPAEQRRG